MRNSFFLILVFIFLINSCKKDNATSSDSSGLIIGKWFVINHVTQYYTNDTLSSTSTQQPYSQDYVEFRNDGSFATFENGGGPFISIYKVESDSIIFENTRKAKIKTLTKSDLSYYFTEKVSSNQYSVNTWNFIKR